MMTATTRTARRFFLSCSSTRTRWRLDCHLGSQTSYREHYHARTGRQAPMPRGTEQSCLGSDLIALPRHCNAVRSLGHFWLGFPYWGIPPTNHPKLESEPQYLALAQSWSVGGFARHSSAPDLCHSNLQRDAERSSNRRSLHRPPHRPADLSDFFKRPRWPALFGQPAIVG
jgi:hypothetical protein